MIEQHFGRDWENAIFVVTQRILSESKAAGSTPYEAAAKLADELMQTPHPMYPGRSRAIIQDLTYE